MSDKLHDISGVVVPAYVYMYAVRAVDIAIEKNPSVTTSHQTGSEASVGHGSIYCVSNPGYVV